MVAETPFLPNADKLGPLASRYLNVADLPWQETRFPGVDMKVLVEDKDSGERRRPHHIDLKSGKYRGRQILPAKAE